MKKKSRFQKRMFYIFLLVLLLLVSKEVIFAQKELELKYPSVPGAETPLTTKTAFPVYVKYIFNFSIMAAGLIVFVSLVYGGFRYLTSAGSPSAITDAKDQIFSGILGLIILLSSYLILNTVNPQLLVFRFGEKEIKPIASKPQPPAEATTTKYVFFQIPLGKIISRAILDDSTQNEFNNAIDTAKETEEKAKKLRDLAQQLKEITDACKCGHSNCNGCSNVNASCCYGNPPQCTISPYCIPEQNCEAKGCPGARCDLAARDKKIEEMKEAIEELRVAQTDFSLPNLYLSDSLSELQTAGILMSLLAEEVEDYNSFLSTRYFLEKDGIIIELDYFPGWDDIKLRANEIAINDPATFYFYKKGNENAIEIAKTKGVFSPTGEFSLPSGAISLPEGLTELPRGFCDEAYLSNFWKEKSAANVDPNPIRPNLIYEASRTCYCESYGNPTARLRTAIEDSRGLFQINILAHLQFDPQKLFEPEYNNWAAIQVYNAAPDDDPLVPWSCAQKQCFTKWRAPSIERWLLQHGKKCP